MPVEQEIYADIWYLHRSSIVDKCDILGRNKTERFKIVLRDVEVVSTEGSIDPVRGQSLIKIRTTVRQWQMLSKYEILQVRKPGTTGP